MLKIGIVGHGFVGKAMHSTFEHNADFVIVDTKYNGVGVCDLIDRDCVFICLPAPTLDDSSVDASPIYDVFRQLSELKYTGIVVLKSTLPPNIVQDLFDSFCIQDKGIGALRYVYSPEFLRQGTWLGDALSPGRIILAGNYFDCNAVNQLYLRHSHVPRHTRFILCDYKEAALLKYAANTFLATKVVFMNQLNQLYTDVCGAPLPESWNAFTDMLSSDPRIGNSHMQVPGPDGNYGYGGTCFPKDMKALHGFDANGRMTVAREAELANTKIRLANK
jgi:UDPglucose 6-dehydrogenase